MIDLIIISGASKGIGLNILESCNEYCKNIIAIGASNKINNINLQSKCNLIKVQQNLSDIEGSFLNIKEIINNINPIPKNIGIVLCAAQLGNYGGLFESNLTEWEELYKSNVLGNLSIIRACKDLICNGCKTRIVFFSGGGAAFPNMEFSGYALTKVAVVRAVENLSIELDLLNKDSSIVALAPGAVDTDMLSKVIASGCNVRTKTKADESSAFVKRFLLDEIQSKKLNGMFLHVRDNLDNINLSINSDIFKLRRLQ